jgi:hypothetical protein
MEMTLANASEFKERACLTRLRDAFALRVGGLVDWLCPCPCLSVYLLAYMRASMPGVLLGFLLTFGGPHVVYTVRFPIRYV